MTWPKSSAGDNRVTRGAQRGVPDCANPRSFKAKRPKQKGRSFASEAPGSMLSTPSTESFTPLEIARAAGVPEAQVLALLGPGVKFVLHAEAVRLGRTLVQGTLTTARPAADRAPLFATFAERAPARRSASVPLALSSTLHAGLVAL